MSEPILRLDKVSVQFNDTFAIKDASLTINEGDFFGIVGPSGAGKSTLVRTVNLLQKPTLGKVFFEGVEITALNEKDLRQTRLKIGMIFQHFNLIKNSSVLDNVCFALKAAGAPKDEIKKKALFWLDRVGLKDKASLFPSDLSGGQKQRVAIARALANEPKILLCDEATSALDPNNTKEVVNTLKEIKSHYPITVLFITHQMEVARTLFNKIAVMDSGKIIEQGLCYDVFANPQHEITKSLVSSSWHLELPHEVFLHEKELFVITYSGNNAYEPLISKVSRDFAVQVPIVGGKIEYISGKPLGILVIGIQGNAENRTAAINFIKTQARLDRLTYKED